jgi:predicted ABC-class ATPase
VDIHSCWLRQEVQKKTIELEWKETHQMIADGLTRALSRVPFTRFVRMIGLEDLAKRLELIQRQDDLQDQLEELKSQEDKGIIAFTSGSVLSRER